MKDKYSHPYQFGHQSISTSSGAIPKASVGSIEKVDSRMTIKLGLRFLSGSTSEMHGVQLPVSA
jgi:hypothetical protein